LLKILSFEEREDIIDISYLIDMRHPESGLIGVDKLVISLLNLAVKRVFLIRECLDVLRNEFVTPSEVSAIIGISQQLLCRWEIKIGD
jgi:hypothetical protein